jgi:hypothetical protein
MGATEMPQPYQNSKRCPILFFEASDREASKERRRKPSETLAGLLPERSKPVRGHKNKTHFFFGTNREDAKVPKKKWVLFFRLGDISNIKIPLKVISRKVFSLVSYNGCTIN